jgi:FAD/FMN-containing dehydrogenase
MTAITGHDLDTLRNRLAGRVITAADVEYDRARSVWNGAIDRRPALITRCGGAADVATAIAFARENEIEISVRGGAHNFGGAAVGDGGLTIDLSGLHQVSVDPAARTARCGGGATLAQLDAATQQHELATTGGTVSHTGVGGLTLGGGFGWLASQFGLTCDNLLSAEIVTADGTVIRTSETEHPDLFWAIRGGGGNFGVVTEFEFRLHPVGPLAQLGLFFWDLDSGPAALAVAQQVISSLPGRMGAMLAGLNAPPAPFVPAEHHFRPGYSLLIAGFGADAEHARLLGEVRAALPPLFEFVTPIPYVALQQMLDESAPWGIMAYERALYIDELTPDLISVITSQLPRKNSPMSMMLAFPMGGAFSSVPDDATAFGGARRPGIAISATGIAADADTLAAEREWSRGFWQQMLPHAKGPGSYVNFMTDYEADRVRAAYGPAKYQRLAEIKADYDPGNVFHRNGNIVPAANGSG